MPRPYKDGLDFWQVDVDAHKDGKLTALKVLGGTDALLTWFILMPEIYRVGCCFRWKQLEDKIIIAEYTGFQIEKVEDHIALMLKVNLLNQKVFDNTGLLTSFGIQKRFFSATGRRKKGIELPPGVLLVDPENYGSKPALIKESREKRERVERESRELLPVTGISNTFTLVNADINPENAGISQNPKTKSHDVKQKTGTTPYTVPYMDGVELIQFGTFLRMAKHQMDTCVELFGAELVAQEIDEADLYLTHNNNRKRVKWQQPTHNHYMFFRVTWMPGKKLRPKLKDGIRTNTKSNFDTYMQLKAKEQGNEN